MENFSGKFPIESDQKRGAILMRLMINWARKIPIEVIQAAVTSSFFLEKAADCQSCSVIGKLKMAAIKGSNAGRTYWVDFTATKKIRYPVTVTNHKKVIRWVNR